MTRYSVQPRDRIFGKYLANNITKVSKNSEQNNSETVTNKHNKEIPKERYISPEERQEIIDELRLKSNWSFKKFTKRIIKFQLQMKW